MSCGKAREIQGLSEKSNDHLVRQTEIWNRRGKKSDIDLDFVDGFTKVLRFPLPF